MNTKNKFAASVGGTLSVLIASVFLVCSASAAQAEPSCEPAQGMTFVCGPRNAEDLVWVPDSDWVIASGMSEEGDGHLYLLNPADHAYEELYPAGAPAHRWDQAEFPDCPGALNPERFSAHGLSILPLGGGRHRLYVTGHGAREAVEIFDVSTQGDKPTVVWRGCVPMPATASINSVAALADGGFITTRIALAGPQVTNDIFAGEISGFLYEWHPGGTVTRLAGTDMSGPNGIVVAQDQQRVFVASWGRSEIVRFVRGDDGGLAADKSMVVGFRVDNLRWTDSGTILATGHRLAADQDCDGPPLCFDEWEVAEIDAEKMTATTLAVRKPIPGFSGATVAIRDDGGLWFGTFRGDRIVYIADEDR